MTIDEMINRKREYGYSYEYISALSGVPASTVQKVLSKQTSAPRRATIEALRKAFETAERSFGPVSTIRDGGSSYGAVSGSSALDRAGGSGKTIRDYLALPDGERVELIDGEFYDLASPTSVHQMLCTLILNSFINYVDANGGSCIPLAAPMDVRLDCDDRTMVQPDVMVICDINKVTKERIEGAPDLIVEVLSPSTWYHDTARKLLKYKKAGVREFWLVDPEHRTIFVYCFEKDRFETYSFEDIVPVGISNGECSVDFPTISRHLGIYYAGE